MTEAFRANAKSDAASPQSRGGRWSIPARHFRWVTATGFLLATGLLVLVIGMAYRETRQQIASSDSVIRSRDVLSAIADFTTATRSATKAVTDYYANGIESDVQTFSSSEKSIHAASARLQSVTLDSSSQHQLAVGLNSQMDQALVFLHQVVELHRQGVKGTEGLAGINTAIKPLSLQLNKSITDITSAESERLKAESNSQAIASRRALRLELWGGVFALLLMLSVLMVFLRESSIRMRAEQELAVTNAQLEQRVRDRMADVERVNNLLRGENRERMAAEEEIRLLNAVLEQRVSERTAQLQLANQEMEAFCYSVSHDLRAPLRHIDGFSKILRDDFGAQMDPEATHCLNRIQTAIHNMGHLVDDLLNLSRLTRSEMATRPVVLANLAKSVLLEMEPDLAGRKIDWKIGALPTVIGDPRLLKQVLVNLFSNALKFTRRCDQAVVEVSHLQRDRESIVVVRDNGVGFDMKYADKLFGVFQRLHTSQQFEGTGVGLATVQRIIQKHGGRVWAESQPGNGASFYFTVNPAPAPAPDSRFAEKVAS
jgi:signal transduction histidine kinase